MRRRALLLFCLLTAACQSDVVERVAALRDAVASLHARTDRVEADLRIDRHHLEAARSTFARARHDFLAAAKLYEGAVLQSGREREALLSARDAYEQAVERWRLAQALIIAAAAYDASRLSERVWRGDFHGDCGEGMSTGAFRRLMEALGVSLFGMDIDHIVPRALGGADHPLNYQILPSRLNQSLGASWGTDKCALAGATACRKAVEVSRACGSFQGAVPSL